MLATFGKDQDRSTRPDTLEGVQSTEVSVFPQKFPIFCGKSKSSIENPKVPRNFWIFRRIRSNFCRTFGFSMEDLDFPSKFQIFRRSFLFSMELSIFPLNFAIFCRTFRSSAEEFGFSAELLDFPQN